jgi:hypothetical protein
MRGQSARLEEQTLNRPAATFSQGEKSHRLPECDIPTTGSMWFSTYRLTVFVDADMTSANNPMEPAQQDVPKVILLAPELLPDAFVYPSEFLFLVEYRIVFFRRGNCCSETE